MQELFDYLPVLLPLIIIELILAVTALLHVLRHPNYRRGSKYIWIPVVLFVQFLGPILYFVWGRGDD